MRGHRARLKQRFAEHGERVFDDHQLLELMLFYAVPQGDVNPLAHRLINHFGSFAAVLDAKPEELRKVKGVGDHTALFLSMFPRCSGAIWPPSPAAKSRSAPSPTPGEFLLPYFFGARNETVFLLCLDAKGKVLSCRCLAEGSLDRVGLNSRQVVETALEDRASSVILAHNHISGLATPSQADVTPHPVSAAPAAVPGHSSAGPSDHRRRRFRLYGPVRTAAGGGFPPLTR